MTVERLQIKSGGYVLTRPVRSTSVECPIRTVSESNQREHWAKKAKRAKVQRSLATLVTRGHLIAVPPCTIKLTRIAPRALDDDNLRGALKACRDGVADALGIKDNDPRVTWEYAQERGAVREYAVRFEALPRVKREKAEAAT